MFSRLAAIAAIHVLLLACLAGCDQSAPPKPPKPVTELLHDSRP